MIVKTEGPDPYYFLDPITPEYKIETKEIGARSVWTVEPQLDISPLKVSMGNYDDPLRDYIRELEQLDELKGYKPTKKYVNTVQRDICYHMNLVYHRKKMKLSLKEINLDLSAFDSTEHPGFVWPIKYNKRTSLKNEDVEDDKPYLPNGDSKLRMISNNSCPFGCNKLNTKRYFYQELKVPSDVYWKFNYLYTDREKIYVIISQDDFVQPQLLVTNMFHQENLERKSQGKDCVMCESLPTKPWQPSHLLISKFKSYLSKKE